MDGGIERMNGGIGWLELGGKEKDGWVNGGVGWLEEMDEDNAWIDGKMSRRG